MVVGAGEVVGGAVVAAVGATVAAVSGAFVVLAGFVEAGLVVSGAFVVGLVGLVADSEDDFSDGFVGSAFATS